MKHKSTAPDLSEEKKLWKIGYRYVAGIDEVGRGCFAGPIVAAAVIFPTNLLNLPQIYDSKSLNAKNRLKLAEIIKSKALSYSISVVPVPFINKYGIGRANIEVLKKAVYKLKIKPLYVLVDGNLKIKFNDIAYKNIIRGDAQCTSIAAASILAKVYRDQLMINLAKTYQNYNFEVNMGYGTKMHQTALSKYGLSIIHRTSFKLQKYLQ